MDSLISGSIQEINISPIRLALQLLLVFVVTRFIVWHYEQYGQSNSFSNAKHSFTIVGLSTVLIISVVKSSLALSLGLVGALSIVRFRTPIKDAEELGYLFLVIATGLAAGAEQEIAILVSVPLILFCLFLINNKREKLGDSGVLYIESNKEIHGKVINFFKSSEMNYSLSRFIKNNDSYIIDVSIDKLSFKDLEEVISQIEDLGVQNITFVTND